MSEIKNRMKGVPETEIQKAVYKLATELEIIRDGAKRTKTYELAKKNKKKIEIETNCASIFKSTCCKIIVIFLIY